jgi:hypothetical protein
MTSVERIVIGASRTGWNDPTTALPSSNARPTSFCSSP